MKILGPFPEFVLAVTVGMALYVDGAAVVGCPPAAITI